MLRPVTANSYISIYLNPMIIFVLSAPQRYRGKYTRSVFFFICDILFASVIFSNIISIRSKTCDNHNACILAPFSSNKSFNSSRDIDVNFPVIAICNPLNLLPCLLFDSGKTMLNRGNRLLIIS